MNTLYGVNVVESPIIQEIPRLQLSHDFNDCSPEFKRYMNDWLREKFGTYLPTYVIGGHTIVVHPKNAGRLKELALAATEQKMVTKERKINDQ